jgi:hypothetical protein
MNEPHYTPHGEDLDHDLDADLTRDFQDEDPAIYGDNRYDESFADFVCPDGSLHARVF